MNTTPCVWNLEKELEAGYILLNSNGQEDCLPDYRITHTGVRELGAFAVLPLTSKTPLILSLWVPVCVGPGVITPPSSQWETLLLVISPAACQGLTVFFCRIFGSVRLTEGVCNL